MTTERLFTAVAMALLLVACGGGQPPVRTDVETVTAAPSAGSPIAWTLPSGWKDKGPSGMRLTTLVTPQGNEVSLSLLPGTGGDLEGNLNRWLGQLNRQVPHEALDRYLGTLQAEKLGGGELLLADLGAFVPEAEAPSMVVALWRLPEGLVTLKMTGPKGRTALDQPSFFSLARSLKIKDQP